MQNSTVSEFGTILRNLLLGKRGREPTRPFSVTSAAPLHRHQPVHTTSAVPVQRTFEGHTQTQSETDAQLRHHSAHGTNSHSGNGAKFSGKPLFSQTQMVGMFDHKMSEGLVSRQHPHLGHGLQIRVGSPRLNKTTQPLGLAQPRQDHLK